MPRYHFHVHDAADGSSPDLEGTDLPDLATARCEALRLAGTTIADFGATRRDAETWRLEVTDHAGLPLFNTDFQVSPTDMEALLLL